MISVPSSLFMSRAIFALYKKYAETYVTNHALHSDNTARITPQCVPSDYDSHV